MSELDLLLVDGVGVEVRATDRPADPKGPSAILTMLDGWHGVEVRGGKVDRIGDGVVSGPQQRHARQLTVGVNVSGLSRAEVVEWQRKLSGLFPTVDGDIRSGLLTVRTLGESLSCAVVPDGRPKVSGNRDMGLVVFELPLRADLPHLYGPARSSTLTPEGAGGGLAYPLAYPLSYGAGTSGGTILSNGGNAPAWPVVTVVVDDPAGFRLDLGGRVVEVVSPCSPDAPITVDMAGTVTAAGGGDITFRLGRREWGSVPPGASVPLTITTMQGGPGYATATVRDTYL